MKSIWRRWRSVVRRLTFEILQVGILDGTPEGTDGGALIESGEEGAAVILGPAHAGRGREADKAGKILILGSQAVEDPRSHGGSHELETSGVQLHKGLWVSGDVAVHAVEEAEVIGVPGEVGEEFRDGETAFAPWFKLPGALHDRTPVNFLSIVDGELRFVVEGVHVGRASAHAGEDHPLGLPRKVRLPGCEGVGGEGGSTAGLGSKPGEGHVTETGGERPESPAAGQIMEIRHGWDGVTG